MEFKFGGSETNQKTILGHPSGLFVLFFTEMWERFSYYGMRALLVLFLTSSLLNEGWGWERADATLLYGWYIGLVYLTPIIGGWIADKFMGFRNAVILGAFIMTLGHASMALEGTSYSFFYLGIFLLIIGNGLFKPNISSIVGQLYKGDSKEKDGAYTIFYMGINAGAFLGILLCGYVGEKAGWHYGFGLAGVFMFFGMLQFYFAQKIFGNIGLSPKKTKDFDDTVEDSVDELEDAVEDVIEEVQTSKVTKDRIIVISVFALFTTFFWWAFEQAGGSMTIFAADYTGRVLEGSAASTFKIVNTIITVVPLAVITYVLLMLFKQTFSKYSLSNIILGSSFVIIWGVVIWLLQNDYNTKSFEVEYMNANGITKTTNVRTTDMLEATKTVSLKVGDSHDFYFSDDKKNKGNTIKSGSVILNDENKETGIHRKATVKEFISKPAKGLFWKNVNYAVLGYNDAKGNEQTTEIFMSDKYKKTEDYTQLSEEKKADHKEIKVGSAYDLILNQSISLSDKGNSQGTVIKQNTDELEIAASWFGILNSLFIIVFASLFSKIWQSKLNPSGPVKFGIGLLLLAIGFGALAYGASSIPEGAKTASVSIIWLILAYLFHTLGELCISPVGLSYVSKLAPVKLVGLMFGIWFISNFLAGVIGGWTASFMDPIQEKYGLSTFFLIFTIIPAVAGLIMLGINKTLIKKMHGIR